MAYNTSMARLHNFVNVCRQSYTAASSQLVHPGRFKIKIAEGFSYDSFNPRAKPSVWSIQRMFEKSIYMGFLAEPGKWGTQFLEVGKFQRMVYFASIQLRCQPELYCENTEKQPAEVDSELVKVGNTSFKIRSRLFLPQLTSPVAEEDMHMVFVDKDTRRPAPPPDWWKDKYRRYSLSDEGEGRHVTRTLAFKQRDLPRLREEEFRVRSMDLDPYCHVNNASYLRYCYETFVSSHIGQHGYTRQGEPFRDVQHLSCTFKGEAGFGDSLHVSFVQDPADEDVHHFQVVKSMEDVICECSMRFFPKFTA